MIKKLIQVIIFLCFLAFLIWNRLIRNKKPRYLLEINYDLTDFLLISGLVILFFSLLLIVIKNIFQIQLFKKKNKYFMKLKELWLFYVISSSDVVLSIISKKYDLIQLLKMPASYMVVYFYYPKAIVFLFLYLPTVCVTSTFFLEIIFFYQISIFYKLIPLLFIPLSVNAWLYIIDKIATAQIDYVSAHLVWIEQQNKIELQLAPESPNIPNAFTLAEMKLHFNWLCNEYEIFSNIKSYCDSIKSIKTTYSIWISLYCLLVLCCSWSYYLYIILCKSSFEF
jgi:hypothetical protein